MWVEEYALIYLYVMLFHFTLLQDNYKPDEFLFSYLSRIVSVNRLYDDLLS